MHPPSDNAPTLETVVSTAYGLLVDFYQKPYPLPTKKTAQKSTFFLSLSPDAPQGNKQIYTHFLVQKSSRKAFAQGMIDKSKTLVTDVFPCDIPANATNKELVDFLYE